QNGHLDVLNYAANAYVPVIARAFSVGTAGNLSVFNGVGLALFAHDAVYMRNSANTAYVNTYGASFTNPSSRTTKHDIKDMSESEAMNILKVRPRTFIYNEDVTGKIQSGAVVEELEEAHIFENVIARDKDGKSNGIDYSKFTAAHIKLTQMHHARITALETENDALKTQLAAMETRIAALEGKQCI
ncbi:MAG: hypothetical protein RR351_06035, partial [Christensenella sp.]